MIVRSGFWLSAIVTLLLADKIFAQASYAPRRATLRTLNGQLIVDPSGSELVSELTPTNVAQVGRPAQASGNDRMSRLRSLNYDRRPSVILKAWSGISDAEEAERKKTMEEAAKEAAASPANATGPAVTTSIVAPTAGASQVAPATTTQPALAPLTPVAAPTSADNTPAAASSAAANSEPAVESSADPAATPENAAEAQAKQAAAQKQQAEAAKKQQEEQQKLDEEMKLLQKNVTLSKWPEVKAYFAGLPADEGKVGYAQMLRSLANPPKQSSGERRAVLPGIGTADEGNLFELDDVFAIATVCPHKIDKKTVAMLAPILRQANKSGTVLTEVIARLKTEAAKPEAEGIFSRRQCAQLLDATGLILEMEPFLPALEEAVTANDAEGINLLARYQLRVEAKEKKPKLLEQAWATLHASLALAKADKKDQEETLKLAVELAPRLKSELGQTWLEKSFTDETERGITILATIGAMASTSLQGQLQQPDARLRHLRLQKTAAEALIKASPDRAKEWQSTLALLAQTWHREAEYSRAAAPSTSIGPRMQRDRWGNFFFMNDEDGYNNMQQMQNQLGAQPIGVSDILEVAPSEEWLSNVDTAIQPRFQALFAQLYLKVAEEDRAFPYIERLATTHPELARDLAHEFVRIWTTNHDPNASRRYSNPYIFMYGYERKAESIPLTRSKQERNLQDLTNLVKRLRALPLTDLDESLFITAFTNCHSTAEVYDLEAIQQVLGSVGALKPKATAELVQKMRANLAGQWRMPAEQEKKKTRRKLKDIQAEVLRGYAVASRVLTEAIEANTENWQLCLAQACLALDQLSFQNALQPDSQFSHRRLAILSLFGKAADLYSKQVSTLPENEFTSLPYEHWFYAGLGASDLGNIDHLSIADERQPSLILAHLNSLPGETAERHQDLFANTLFTRMSALKPNVKFRYLEAGFQIVGDHKQAREARSLYDYYKDLVTEIKLVTRVDGPAKVGADEPFGVFVELVHTREIERESGGFGRYLQNQQGNMYFSYNYGRPLENYREKFEEAVRAALAENFDVQSVTFQAEDAGSRATRESGWRSTPYAYVLLKARGPQVDKLPSLKMDLDFLDTSGYVVLPVTSPAQPVDASQRPVEGRPCGDLKITQTLDERQAADGKLVLEIKASGNGLVPKLEDLLDLKFSEFTLDETEDQGLSVSKFDPDSSEPAVISERTWILTLLGRKDLSEQPKVFEFGDPKIETAEVTYQRYDDADLAAVERVVSLEQKYGDVRRPWMWGLLAVVPIGLVAVLGVRGIARRRKPTEEARFKVPESMTPFSVLALLRNIADRNGLEPEERNELSSSIEEIERHYFALTNGNGSTTKPDLKGLAETWIRRAK